MAKFFHHICGQCIMTPCCGYRKHCQYVKLYITSSPMAFLGIFFLSKCNSNQEWQNINLFITLSIAANSTAFSRFILVSERSRQPPRKSLLEAGGMVTHVAVVDVKAMVP